MPIWSNLELLASELSRENKIFRHFRRGVEKTKPPIFRPLLGILYFLAYFISLNSCCCLFIFKSDNAIENNLFSLISDAILDINEMY